MQHVYSTHVRKGSAQNHSLHMYSMHGDPTVVYSTCSPFSFVTCLLNIGGVILNLMYKKASLSDVLWLQLCMSTETISFSRIASYSLYEPKSHALMEYTCNGGLEKAILRDSELLSEVNDAFCISHPLLAQKVVTRSARAAVSKIGADALVGGR